MDIRKEIQLIKEYFDSNCKDSVDFCELDLSNLEEPWPDPQSVHKAVCAFKPLIKNLISAENLPALTFNFIKGGESINDRITLVKLNGVKFLMKQEEYILDGDLTLHEYFVGIHLNKLKEEIPTFASVLGAYSCTPFLPIENNSQYVPCAYTGNSKQNVNYVLYNYIKGPTLYEALSEKIITPEEGWICIFIIHHSLIYVNKKIGFIHQDLHGHNIILKDLLVPTSIPIGNVVIVSRYLPIIIDFARSQIKIEDTIFSPYIPEFGIPAKNNNLDLVYLIFGFTLITGDKLFKIKSLSDAHKVPYTELDYVIKTLHDKYYRRLKPEAQLEIAKILSVNIRYPPCSPQRPIPQELQQKFENRVLYIKGRIYQQHLVIDLDNVEVKDRYKLLQKYFDLMFKHEYPLRYEDEIYIIHKAMTPFMGLKSDIKPKYKKYLDMYENDPLYN